jgi:hypothetical protein
MLDITKFASNYIIHKENLFIVEILFYYCNKNVKLWNLT